MGAGDKCCVGGCDNDRRYPGKYYVHSHVEKLGFHKPANSEDAIRTWCIQVQKGRKDFKIGRSRESVIVCSNHFVDGRPTKSNPIPTLFLTPFEHSTAKSPKKRRKLNFTGESSPANIPGNPPVDVDVAMDEMAFECSVEQVLEPEFKLCTASAQITRENDVRLYTGFQSTAAFKTMFDFLSQKASNMTYWKGDKQTSTEKSSRYDNMDANLSAFVRKRGPPRKLTLEQELLLVMMRLRLALCVGDLAFRFKISESLVSSIFCTWIKMMSEELSWLIQWPSRSQIKKTLPACFKKNYSKVRCIIDCSEIFIETPSSLEVQAACWSDYKHHCTFKFLIGITPNGLISFISECYGGRASDKFIVMDSKFLRMLEPYDQVMADRGFKIRDDLAMYQASLAIPPSAAKDQQMLGADVAETSKIANVRIYVEQAIGRLKYFNILSSVMPIKCVPLCDYILTVCCALCNLLPPLCE
jgi:hypothetical protein